MTQKTLIIVESGEKASEISKMLGNNYIIKASYGHIRTLASKGKTKIPGINDDFTPIYENITSKYKQIDDIKKSVKLVDKILLASDPDREGEAIAYHCAIVFGLDITTPIRISYNEITKTAILNAINTPRLIDMSMVHSQEARMILDKLIGFDISPLLWKNIKYGLSAGRVQSCVLGLIYNKKQEINDFYSGNNGSIYKTIGVFTANDTILKGHLNIDFDTQEEAMTFINKTKNKTHKISDIIKSTYEVSPPAPYTTSSIQQDIYRKYKMNSKTAMSILQKLYESGKITYHRTDSTTLSSQILNNIKEYIYSNIGQSQYKYRTFKTKQKNAQEAHEAIRPTNILLSGLEDDESITNKIYKMVWKRTIASQMINAKYEKNTIKIHYVTTDNNNKQIQQVQQLQSDEYYSVINNKLIVKGYLQLYNNADDTTNDTTIDTLQINQVVILNNITSTETYKEPPKYYNESDILSQMEKLGIGRPSTYHTFVPLLTEREYILNQNIEGIKKNISIISYTPDTLETKQNDILESKNDDIIVSTKEISIGNETNKINITPLGEEAIIYLNTHFSHIFNPIFTSNVETQLDEIANNNIIWHECIRNVYNTYNPIVTQLNLQIKPTKTNELIGTIDNINYYKYKGPYGWCIQREENNKKTYITLPEQYDINNITINDIQNIINNNILGLHNNIPVYLKKGKYGQYIQYNNKNYAIKDKDTINIETAISLIESTTAIKVDEYVINKGPYGYYIKTKTKNYKIPETYDVNNITSTNIKDIITKNDATPTKYKNYKKYTKK